MKIIVLLLVMSAISVQCFGDVRIVVHPSVSETRLSRQDINDIYLGKKLYWKDKSKIHVARLTDEKINMEFLEKYLNKTPGQYRQHRQKKVFTGPVEGLVSFNTNSQMIEYIATTPGAIGYVDSGAGSDKVKIPDVVD